MSKRIHTDYNKSERHPEHKINLATDNFDFIHSTSAEYYPDVNDGFYTVIIPDDAIFEGL